MATVWGRLAIVGLVPLADFSLTEAHAMHLDPQTSPTHSTKSGCGAKILLLR